MNVLGADIFQVDVVDLGGVFHVLCHLRFCDRELDLFAGPPQHFAHLLVHLEKSRTSGNPVRLQCRRHREANRLFGAAFVCDHELRL